MLLFQVPDGVPWVRRSGLGSSFVLVVTRDRTRVHRLPEEKVLAPRISLYLGFLDRRDGSDAEGSAGLYRDVLAGALRDLPDAVTRLVLVPDKALFRLPFDALRPAPGAPPVAARYEISIAPSAALWLRWRHAGDSAATGPAFVVADPVLPDPPGAPVAEETERGPAVGVELGPLPHARQEARAIVRALGRTTRAVLGAEASEATVAAEDLRRYGVVHFAAHAVIDDLHPDRSALVLSAGDAGSDGLLHVREIVRLDLGGAVVVLSACRSSAGPLLGGEGPMSLARGFFQAGARAVVGSLWPLRDDEAASFVTRFYRHLGAGASVGDALARARRDAIESGAPAAAWAGWVVMGDGSVTPVPGDPRGIPRVLPYVALPALVAIAGLVVWRRRRNFFPPR
jgi:CHAT domain-containing protein